ncbi:MAG: ROK family protein [Desulfobacterales bacterium]
MEKVYGGIEAGGTKFVCGVGSGPDDLEEVVRFPTTTPRETLCRAIEFFKAKVRDYSLGALGIASFGPVDLNPRSGTYGQITQTPKPGWSHTDLAGTIQSALGLPVGFDTDVNGAALAEHRWGAAQDVDTFIYLTVGTGIGGGGMLEGKLMHGLVHPEMGHIPLPRDPDKDPSQGICPFHGDCLEGLATGPALAAKWNCKAEDLSPDHPAWDLEAHYLALGLASFICTLSPRRIILGGGVMAQKQLFPMVRQRVQRYLNGYVRAAEILEGIDAYIVPPKLGNRAGVLGAIALAQLAESAH